MESLIAGYARALDEAKDWLTPAAIRELCVGRVDEREAVAAWDWAYKYVHYHGSQGKPMLGGLLDNNTLAPDTPAPEIPPRLLRTLERFGSTPSQGLSYLATRFDDDFTRREFVRAFIAAGANA